VLENRSELQQVLRRSAVLGAVFARHAYGMRRWVDEFAARIPELGDPDMVELVAEIVSQNARHMVMFRNRAIAHQVDPDRYVCPPEGELIYERMTPLDDHGALEYALGSLEHFSDLLAVYADAAEDSADAGVLAQVRAENDRAVARLRRVVRDPTAPAAADAHELYRLRELAEAPLYANGH
jgi:hypothetical protein